MFVQQQVGHSYSSTTALYTSVSSDYKQKTIQRMIALETIAMAEQRRISYHWNLRQLMAQRNLWKTTGLTPLLRSRGINLSPAQVHRLVTSTPECIPARTFAALCDILDCTPNDLFEPFVEIRAAATAEAPTRSEDIGVKPGQPIARRVKLVRSSGDED